MMIQRRSPDLRAYFVWGRFSGNDDEAHARESTKKYAAPNAAYFWVPVPVAQQELTSVLRIAPGQIVYDVYLLYRKSVLWESQIPTPTYWQQQLGILQGDRFDITRLETQIQRLSGK
jgi:hypothetical protein